MKRTIVATGLGIGLVAGAGAGFILQSSGLAGASPASSPAAVAAVAATDDGAPADTDQDRPDHAAHLSEVLQPLVDAGTITADQMTAVIDALVAAHPHDEMGGEGHGPMGEMHGRMGGDHGPGPGLDAAAGVLGLDIDELMTQLRDGETLADLATSAGVDVQAVIDAMLAEARAHLDERVASGDLTQAEADARLAELTDRIDDVVRNGRPDRPGQDRPGRPGHSPDAADDGTGTSNPGA